MSIPLTTSTYLDSHYFFNWKPLLPVVKPKISKSE